MSDNQREEFEAWLVNAYEYGDKEPAPDDLAKDAWSHQQAKISALEARVAELELGSEDFNKTFNSVMEKLDTMTSDDFKKLLKESKENPIFTHLTEYTKETGITHSVEPGTINNT